MTPPPPKAGQPPCAGPAVFTAPQATRGEREWRANCARCHKLSEHSGEAFATKWHMRRVSDLYDILVNTMPQDEPGSLSDAQYVDIIAYLLRTNGMPAGSKALSSSLETMRSIRIHATARQPK